MNVNDVDIFVPCCVDQLYPQTAFNMIKVLKHLGVKVHYNAEQTCCGKGAFTNGYWDEAKEIGEKFIRNFGHGRYIVSPSADCVGYIKNHYAKLFYNTGLHLEYRQLQNHIFEFTDYLVNMLRVTDLGAVFPHKVTYHDACSALRDYGIKEEPRLLLSHVRDLELVEMAKSDHCCGFGGTFSLKYEPISVAMTEQKISNALATGAEYIVTTEVTCMAQMESYIKKQKLNIKCLHVADVLSSGIGADLV